MRVSPRPPPFLQPFAAPWPPLTLLPATLCSVPRQGYLAKVFHRTNLIVWDEAPMMNRRCFEAVERMLRDIMQNDHLFGGKVLSARVPPPCSSDREGS